MENEKRFFSEEEIMVELYDRVVHGSPAGAQFANAFSEFLKEIPTVDAVEVVRCKDCIRRYDTDECPMCYLSGGQYVEYTSGNSYCSRGERKDGDGNGE